MLDEFARDEGDPGLKVVVFTEFTETQRMLLTMFEDVGVTAVAINGGMGIHERAEVQQRFLESARVLVSTDAGGEGINLQFAHVVVNYDLPWSPSRVEQRIGRVDRIGQVHPVQAANLVAENSVDARVLEVLETKLAIILAELGSDKAGDILSSADHYAEGLYTAAIMGPEMSDAVMQFESTTRTEAESASEFFDLVEHDSPTPTIGKGEDSTLAFAKAAEARATLLGEIPRYSPIDHLPEVSPEEPIPSITGSRAGLFSLWEVNARPGDRSCVAVFLTDEQTARPDIADEVWYQLAQEVSVVATPPLDEEEWLALWEAGWGYAVRPDNQQSGDSPPPTLTLRLLVRVLS
jgi:hypothetical protein